jgi:hypothetical protein
MVIRVVVNMIMMVHDLSFFSVTHTHTHTHTSPRFLRSHDLYIFYLDIKNNNINITSTAAAAAATTPEKETEKRNKNKIKNNLVGTINQQEQFILVYIFYIILIQHIDSFISNYRTKQ